MGFLAGIPEWAWFFIFFAALIFVYGLLNRRWRRQEMEEQQRQQQDEQEKHAWQAAKASAPKPARAASLHAPDHVELPPDAPQKDRSSIDLRG